MRGLIPRATVVALGLLASTSFHDVARGQSVPPPSIFGRATGGGQVQPLGPLAGEVVFGFSAKSDSHGVDGKCLIHDENTDVIVKCLDVVVFVKTGPHATLFGNAVVNGVATGYRMDVNDGGEDHSAVDTFALVTDDGYAVAGTVLKGNIQVRD